MTYCWYFVMKPYYWYSLVLSYRIKINKTQMFLWVTGMLRSKDLEPKNSTKVLRRDDVKSYLIKSCCHSLQEICDVISLNDICDVIMFERHLDAISPNYICDVLCPNNICDVTSPNDFRRYDVTNCQAQWMPQVIIIMKSNQWGKDFSTRRFLSDKGKFKNESAIRLCLNIVAPSLSILFVLQVSFNCFSVYLAFISTHV